MEENKQENINCVWLTLTEFCLFIMIFKIYINNICFEKFDNTNTTFWNACNYNIFWQLIFWMHGFSLNYNACVHSSFDVCSDCLFWELQSKYI